MRIFATVGSRTFSFDRMIQAIDEALGFDKLPINTTVLAQVGSGSFKPRYLDTIKYLDRDEFLRRIQEADVVIAHGGTGVIVTALSCGKRVIAFPRMAAYGEHVDDHQVEFLHRLENKGLLRVCADNQQLVDVILDVLNDKPPSPYKSNTQEILGSIRAYIDGLAQLHTKNATATRRREEILSDRNSFLFTRKCTCSDVPEKNQSKNAVTLEIKRSASMQFRVLHCGSVLTEPGGIASGCRQLMNHNWGDEIVVDYIATHISGFRLRCAIVFIKGFRQIRSRLKRHEVDLVHLHLSQDGSFFRKYAIAHICNKYNVPYLVHMHGSRFTPFFENSSMRVKQAVTTLLEEARAVIVLSERRKRFCAKVAPKARIAVIPNAVPICFSGRRKRCVTFGITYLGRLVPVKGVDDLLRGYSQFLANKPSFEGCLYIAGAGDEEDRLRIEVKTLGITRYVSFLGWLNETSCHELLNKTDVLVLPSRMEEFGRVLIEAMSVGIPPIATRVGGVESIINNEVEGLLVNPNSPHEIAEALERLYNDEQLWQTCSQASLERAAAEFDENSFFSRIATLYTEAESNVEEENE